MKPVLIKKKKRTYSNTSFYITYTLNKQYTFLSIFRPTKRTGALEIFLKDAVINAAPHANFALNHAFTTANAFRTRFWIIAIGLALLDTSVIYRLCLRSQLDVSILETWCAAASDGARLTTGLSEKENPLVAYMRAIVCVYVRVQWRLVNPDRLGIGQDESVLI